MREHWALEAKRQQQREREQRNREAKAARKAEYERQQQVIAARKAALLAQGITPESRAERNRCLAREAARSQALPRAEIPAVFERRSPSSPPSPPARAAAGVGRAPRADAGSRRARAGPAAAAGRVQEETPRRAAPR